MSEVGVFERRCPQICRHEVCPFQLGIIERRAVQCDPRRVDTAQVRLRENGSTALGADENGIGQAGIPEISILEDRVVQNCHGHIGRLRIGLHELRSFQVDAFQIGLL